MSVNKCSRLRVIGGALRKSIRPVLLTLAPMTVAAIAFTATPAHAAVITYNLPYIGPPVNPGPTFSGDGFVTAFSDGSFVNAFSMDNAHSYFQVDISALAGTTITNASLNFNIGGGAMNEPVTFTSFESNGLLGSHFTPPNTLATQVFTVDGSVNFVPNSLDVTALLTPRVTGGNQFFALHFAPVNDISDLFVQPSGPGEPAAGGDVSACPRTGVPCAPRRGTRRSGCAPSPQSAEGRSVRHRAFATHNPVRELDEALSSTLVDVRHPHLRRRKLLRRSYVSDMRTGSYATAQFLPADLAGGGGARKGRGRGSIRHLPVATSASLATEGGTVLQRASRTYHSQRSLSRHSLTTRTSLLIRPALLLKRGRNGSCERSPDCSAERSLDDDHGNCSHEADGVAGRGLSVCLARVQRDGPGGRRTKNCGRR